MTVNEQEFKVEGFDAKFRNIEGVLGDGKGSEFPIESHYDTIRDSPGPNDNGSGVAVMLESVRVLAQEKKSHNLRFISFMFEERNPAYELRARIFAQNRARFVHIQRNISFF